MPPDSGGNSERVASEFNPALARLRPLFGRDRELVHRWLLDTEVRRWWGDAASASAEIRLAMESATAICRLIEPSAGSEPIGYAHAMEFGVRSGDFPKGLNAGTWDCDLFIASSAHRGHGFGQVALAQLVAEVFSSTLAIACAITISIRNERAARAYEQIGFRWIGIHDDPIVGPSWIMRCDRPDE